MRFSIHFQNQPVPKCFARRFNGKAALIVSAREGSFVNSAPSCQRDSERVIARSKVRLPARGSGPPSTHVIGLQEAWRQCVSKT